eukprot:g16884.t1
MQMARMLQMACICLLTIFARAQELQDCSVVDNPFTVGSTEDASTLAASLRCSTGDFDVQWVGEVFVAETIHVTSGTSLTITGSGRDAIVDGRAATQLFVVDRGSSLHFSDMTFAHGNASFGGAINALEASVSFSGNASFISNAASVDGGAIFANRSTIFWDGDRTRFILNSADGDPGFGGAIAVYESNVSWSGDGTQFISNMAVGGGGAISAADESYVFWDVDGTEFSNNSAASKGGAIFAWESTVSCDGDGTLFSNNSAFFNGGAIYVYDSRLSWGGDDTVFSFNYVYSNSSGGSGGAVFLAEESNGFWDGDGTQFRSNYASIDGGAIFVDDYSFMSWDGDDTLFSFNSALRNGGAIEVADYSGMSWDGNDAQFNFNSANGSGGAIYVDESSVYWGGNYTLFSFNSVNDSGGAIHATNNEAELIWGGDDLLFSSNSARVNGGAISLDNGDFEWNGDGCQLSSNFANGSGGAVYASQYSSFIWNGNRSQFSSNSAGDDGGAIFLTGYSDMEMTSSAGSPTFSRNTAGENGGAIASVGCYSSMAHLDGGTFIENSARHGGALYFASSIFNFTQAVFQSNAANGGGGVVVLSRTTDHFRDTDELSTSIFTRCSFLDNMSETGGAVETLAGSLESNSCVFEGNSADEGGAMRLVGPTTIRECSFLSNSASVRGLAVVASGAANISYSSFEGNELHCAAGSYRKDTNTDEEEPTARYEVVCLDCPDWAECSGCSIARGNVVPTCEAPLENTEATQPGTTLETLDIARGYWRATNDSDNVLACYNADACIGGRTGADDFCAPGYTGPYCAVCETDFFPSLSYTCTRCSSSRRGGLMAAIVIAVLVVSCALVATVQYLVSTKQLEEGNAGCFRRRILRAIPLQALKIIVVVWQILTQFADAASVTYPGVYQDFLSAIDVVNFDLGSVLSAGCLWFNVDFHDRLLVNTLGPLVVVGLLGITYWIAMYRNNSITASGDAVVEQIRYRHQTVLLLVTFLIYSSVSSTVFQTFACETLDDGIEYLRADYTILCKDAKHKAFEVYAGIMFAVYPIGIPLLYSILLLQRRDVLASADVDKTRAQSISSLWEPYRPERFYYEVVECGRRIMLTGVVVFISPSDAAQIAITMLLAFFFLAIFEMLRPYASESDMWICRGGHVIVFLSMFYLLLQKLGNWR